MRQFTSISIRIFLIFGFTAVALFSAASPVQAQGIVVGDTVPAGTTIDGDAILYGDKITISGTVDGDVLAIGRDVTVDGDINGSLVVGGQNVSVDGQIDGTLYSAAALLELTEQANLNRNLYFGGFSLNTSEGSTIGRDLIAASLGAQLNGAVNGDIRAIVGPLEFFAVIMEKIDEGGLLSAAIEIAASQPDWVRVLPVRASQPSLASASIGSYTSTPELGLQQSASLDWDQIGNWLLVRLRTFLTLFIFGLIGLWLFPRVITGSATQLRARSLPATGYGLLGLVIAVNLAGVVILLAVIILAIGLFLGFATMWELAWAFMFLGFFSLGMITTIFALFVLYISKVIVAFLAGAYILERWAPRAARYKVLSLLLGLTIYVLLVAIPLLGWVIAVLVTALGLGAAWLYYRASRSLSLQAMARDTQVESVEETVENGQAAGHGTPGPEEDSE